MNMHICRRAMCDVQHNSTVLCCLCFSYVLNLGMYSAYCLNVACLSDFHKTKNGWRGAFSFKYSWLMKCFVYLCDASDNIYMFLLSIKNVQYVNSEPP